MQEVLGEQQSSAMQLALQLLVVLRGVDLAVDGNGPEGPHLLVANRLTPAAENILTQIVQQDRFTASPRMTERNQVTLQVEDEFAAVSFINIKRLRH